MFHVMSVAMFFCRGMLPTLPETLLAGRPSWGGFLGYSKRKVLYRDATCLEFPSRNLQHI